VEQNKSLIAELEALLFVSGEEGVEISQLSKATKKNILEVHRALAGLQQSYEKDSNSALNILEVGSRLVLTTKAELSYVLAEYSANAKAALLSKAALETLAIIAYKQPIARSQIDEIRGVSSSGSVQKLQLRNLIEEKGRMETPGKPILYGTTDYFMNYFGLKSFSELPDIRAMEKDFIESEVDLFSKMYDASE
jgi:segregation and condensation protein B